MCIEFHEDISGSWASKRLVIDTHTIKCIANSVNLQLFMKDKVRFWFFKIGNCWVGLLLVSSNQLNWQSDIHSIITKEKLTNHSSNVR